MEDKAWSLTGRGADALSTDPISVASFVHGQGVCATKFAAAVLVSSLQARRPADDPLFDELVMRMATACSSGVSGNPGPGVKSSSRTFSQFGARRSPSVNHSLWFRQNALTA